MRAAIPIGVSVGGRLFVRALLQGYGGVFHKHLEVVVERLVELSLGMLSVGTLRSGP